MLSGRQKNIPKHQNTPNKYAFLAYVKSKLRKRCSSRASSVYSRQTRLQTQNPASVIIFLGGFCCFSLLGALTRGIRPHVDAFLRSMLQPQSTRRRSKTRQTNRRERTISQPCVWAGEEETRVPPWPGFGWWLRPEICSAGGGPDVAHIAHQLMSYNDLCLFSF